MPDVLISEITQAIDKIKLHGVVQDDFFTSKNSMYGSMIEEFENVEEVATNMVTAHFKNHSLYTPLERLGELTLQDVNEQLETMFCEEKSTVFTIMPMGGK